MLFTDLRPEQASPSWLCEDNNAIPKVYEPTNSKRTHVSVTERCRGVVTKHGQQLWDYDQKRT